MRRSPYSSVSSTKSSSDETAKCSAGAPRRLEAASASVAELEVGQQNRKRCPAHSMICPSTMLSTSPLGCSTLQVPSCATYSVHSGLLLEGKPIRPCAPSSACPVSSETAMVCGSPASTSAQL